MSMRWRLIGAFILIIVIALGTVAVVARYTTQQEVATFLVHGGQVGLENLANNLEDYYAETGSWTGANALFAGSGSQGRGQGQGAGGNGAGSGNPGGNANNNANAGILAAGDDHVLTDANGQVIFSPVDAEVGNVISPDLLSSAIELQVSDQVIGYLFPESGVPTLPDNFEELLIERVNKASLLAALISGGVAILLALVFAALILRPIRGLTKAVDKMADGDLSQRVKVKGGWGNGCAGEHL